MTGPEQIRQWATEHLQANGSGNWLDAACPLHEDDSPSLRINVETGGAHCHAGCEIAPGTVWRLAELAGLPTPPDLSPLERQGHAVEVFSTWTHDGKTYFRAIYMDRFGSPYRAALRVDSPGQKKTVRPQHPISLDPLKWKTGEGERRLILLRLPDLMSHPEPKAVLVVEGEKAVHSLTKVGVMATTLPMGSGQDPASVDNQDLTPLLRFPLVVLCPDNDPPGRSYMVRWGRRLLGLGLPEERLVVLDPWAGRRKGFDVADFLAEGKTKPDLAALPRTPWGDWVSVVDAGVPDLVAAVQDASVRALAGGGDLVAQIVPCQLALLEQTVMALGGTCDGAQDRDGIGFNNSDAAWMAPHVQAARAGTPIAQGLRPKVLSRLLKYGAQAFALGFNLNEVSAEEDRLRKEARAEAASEGDRPTQAEVLLDLLEASNVELFHDGGTPFATVLETAETGSRRTTYRVGPRSGFRQWLLREFRRTEGKPPSAEAVQVVLAQLEAEALDAPERRVFLRVASHEGRLYLDLANPAGEVVEVSETGWRLTTDPPVLFVRPGKMQALPAPETGGCLRELEGLLHLPDENAFRLVVSWLLYTLHEGAPFPVLLIEGEQGSSKSTMARLLRNLVDPSSAPTRRPPGEEKDLAVTALGNWVVALDNLSSVPEWLSDALCCISTGGALGGRRLYTDDEEAVLSYIRPVLVTGIGGLTGKPDLGDRLLRITLEAIPDQDRVLEADLVARYEEARPRILGALLTAASASLKNAGIQLPPLPRMADFAAFVIRAEEALPWPGGGFLEAWHAYRQDLVQGSLQADPVGAALLKLLEQVPTWEGTASRLLERLRDVAEDARGLPRSGAALGKRLRVLGGFLRSFGVEITSEKGAHGVRTLHLVPKNGTGRPEEQKDLPPLLPPYHAKPVDKGLSRVAGLLPPSCHLPPPAATKPNGSIDRPRNGPGQTVVIDDQAEEVLGGLL